MTEPRTREYGEIIGGSRYPHWLRFREADGTTVRDVSAIYEADSFAAVIRRNGSLFEDALAMFAVTEDLVNGNVLLKLTAAQTRALNGQITDGLMEVQAVAAGETDPDTIFLLPISVSGDAAR